uniref:Uncharacterized protein n=1 Tax=Anguilla anguilla TaxID=7936 RepID=A0A0E9QEK9_ANGAN
MTEITRLLQQSNQTHKTISIKFAQAQSSLHFTGKSEKICCLSLDNNKKNHALK